MLGVDDVVVAVTSQVLRTIGKVELVLVLDNTGSMKGTKIDTLITAANQLVNSLGKATKNPADLRIGLVPFSQTVNVGSEYQTADVDRRGRQVGRRQEPVPRPEGQPLRPLQEGRRRPGAAASRRGRCPMRSPRPSTDEDVDSLYVPYFAPDEPGAQGQDSTYNNSYLANSSIAAIASKSWRRADRLERQPGSTCRASR